MKNTKKALLMSCISMLLCISMLVGSTFAWFTDTASTGVNQIIAGNLDVELEYTTDFTSWKTVKGKTDLFDPAAKWEPGHTEVVYLRIRNAGDLALNYRFVAYAAAETIGINVAGDEFKLSDALQFAVVVSDTAPTAQISREEAQAAASTNSYKLGSIDSITGEELQANAAKYLTVVVYMPGSVGNNFNYKTGTTPPQIDLAIRLEATQATVESDSYDEFYDKFADGTPDHPEFGEIINTVETKQDALDTTITENEGKKVETVKTETEVEAGGIKVTYPVGAVLDNNSSKDIGDSSADATQGLSYTGSESDKNIIINSGNTLAVYELKLPTSQENTAPVMVVENIGVGQNINSIYHEGVALTKADSTNPDQSSWSLTGDEGYWYYDKTAGDLYLWVLHASEIAIDFNGLFSGGTGTAADPYQIATVQELMNIYFCDGSDYSDITYYQLAADITACDAKWQVWGNSAYIPLLENAVLDGNGHTITFGENQYLPGAGSTLIVEAKNATIKNLKVADLTYCLAIQTVNCVFDDVDLLSGEFTATGNEGAYMVYAWESVHFLNCDTNVDLIGSGETANYNAAFVGYAGHNGTKKFDMSFTNCTNTGDIICGTAAMFLANPSQINPGGNTANWTLKITNCVNNGTIQSTYMGSGAYEENHVVAVYNDQHFKHHFPNIVVDGETVANIKDVVIPCGTDGKFIRGPQDADLAITKNPDGTFTITPSKNANVASYQVSLTLYTGLVSQVGSSRYSVSETITVGEDVSLITAMKQLSFVGLEYLSGKTYTQAAATFNSEVEIVTIDGQNYYLVNDDELTLNGNIRPAYLITVSAFDADGTLLASTGLSN